MKRIKKTNSKKTDKKPAIKLKQNTTVFKAGIIMFTFFFISIYFIPEQQKLLSFNLNKGLFYFISVFFSFIIFISIFFKEKTKSLSKYIFLFLMLFSIVISFLQYTSMADVGNLLYVQLISIQKYLIIPSSAIGIISLWLNKEKLNKTINMLFFKELKSEKGSLKKHIKTNYFQPISFLFTKKEFLSTSVLFAIIGISVFTHFYKLDYFDLYSDEAQVVRSATGYYKTGEFYPYDFVKQKTIKTKPSKRALPHIWTVAQSYKFFELTTWSSRLPSALFGLFLTLLSYFLARFFLKIKTVGLLVSLSLALFFYNLQLERWARMYAMLTPLFLITSYSAFRFINENSLKKTGVLKNKDLFFKYLNYNFSLVPILLFLIYINFKLHANSLLILLISYFYVVFAFLIFKEKKHVTGIVLGLAIIIPAFYFVPNIQGIVYKLSLFKAKNIQQYTEYIFNYPLNASINIVLLIVGSSFFFFSKNIKFKKSLLFLYISIVTTWLLFAILIDYPASFRYISYISPLIIILLVGLFVLINKTLFNKYIQYLLIITLVVSIILQFAKKFNDLYVSNPLSPAHPSVAWKTISKDCKKNEIVFRHWGSLFYMNGIDSTAKILDIGHYIGKPFKQVYDTLQNHKSGWLTWMTHNSQHINTKVINYANLYFDKLHGLGIDSTGVEVFHYRNTQLADTNSFIRERYLPFANLNLKNTYSFAFWLTMSNIDTTPPILFLKNKQSVLNLHLKNDTSFCVEYKGLNKKLIAPTFELNKFNHIVFLQNNKAKSLYVNGLLVDSVKTNWEADKIVKFKLNKMFKGAIDDIRIYDFALSQEGIQLIMQKKGDKKSDLLIVNNKPIKTLFHWQRK